MGTQSYLYLSLFKWPRASSAGEVQAGDGPVITYLLFVYFNILDDQVWFTEGINILDPFYEHLHDEYALDTTHFSRWKCQKAEGWIHRFLIWWTVIQFIRPRFVCKIAWSQSHWKIQELFAATGKRRNLILSDSLKLDVMYFQTLLNSLPNQIHSVIKARSGVTWY